MGYAGGGGQDEGEGLHRRHVRVREQLLHRHLPMAMADHLPHEEDAWSENGDPPPYLPDGEKEGS